MWTATLDFSHRRVLLMRLLSRFWPGVCLTSLSPLSVQNLPRPSLPANNWVRVRNRLAGVSGKDLRLLCGEGNTRIAPAALGSRYQTYPGHEAVGEVIEVGENVQHLRVGDRVILQHNPNCVSAGMQQLCRSCAVAEYNLCERALFPGPQPIGGGWSEEMLLHEQLLFPVTAELSDEQAVMLEPTAVALHALLRRPPQPGEQVLIVGAGTIGLLTLQLARALVPQATVSVLARHSFQVEQATRMGAAHIIYPNDSYTGVQSATGAQRYQGMLGNRMLMGGYDVIYDTVGSNKTLHHTLRWTRAQGAVVLVGIEPEFMHIDLSPLWFQQVSLLGSQSHGMDYWPLGTQHRQTTFSIAQQLLKDGQIHPEQLITQRFALNNYREALSTAMNKSHSRAIKVVFDYSLLPASVVPNVRASARKPRPAVVNSSATPRRTAETDAIQDWPDIPVTTLPEPIDDESQGEETAHALPAIPRSGGSPQSSARPTLQPSGDDRQHQPHTTGMHEAPVEEPVPAQPYIAEEDEATIVVRMSDVHAAQRAMQALQSELEAQHQETLEAPLPSTDDWQPQENAIPVPEAQEQATIAEAESTEQQPVSIETAGETEPIVAEEQSANLEAESGKNEPVIIEEEEQQAETTQQAEIAEEAVEPQTEEQPLEEVAAEGEIADNAEEQQLAEAGSAISEHVDTEPSVEHPQVTDWPEMQVAEMESEEEPSQASQSMDKPIAARSQTRQRSSNRRSKSKR
jgi:threonine dehydrogenase-like Zn-dependent dehydrogenase